MKSLCLYFPPSLQTPPLPPQLLDSTRKTGECLFAEESGGFSHTGILFPGQTEEGGASPAAASEVIVTPERHKQPWLHTQPANNRRTSPSESSGRNSGLLERLQRERLEGFCVDARRFTLVNLPPARHVGCEDVPKKSRIGMETRHVTVIIRFFPQYYEKIMFRFQIDDQYSTPLLRTNRLKTPRLDRTQRSKVTFSQGIIVATDC